MGPPEVRLEAEGPSRALGSVLSTPPLLRSPRNRCLAKLMMKGNDV